MELIYKKDQIIGDVEPSDVRGYWFATYWVDEEPITALIKGKKEAIKYVKHREL